MANAAPKPAQITRQRQPNARTHASLAILIAIVIICITAAACSDQNTDDESPSSSNLATVSPETALIAHQNTISYLSDKPWGFFGATCDQWIQTDYIWQPQESQLLPDGRISVIYHRNQDRTLGPEKLIFYVDLDTMQVQGDNDTQSQRLGVAEGCDKV